MNTSNIKKYATQARADFIAAITNRAAQLGITADGIEPSQVTGAGVVIGAVTHPAAIAEGRQRVVDAIADRGFQAVIEQVAYTWFNRFVALRFMELHGYLDHGLRVLSNAGEAAVPEAVERLRDLDLPTLDKNTAIDMAMTGQQDEDLFRLILLAQCKQLKDPMPWLFDTRLHDGVDLLLPEGLLATDSILAKLVAGIPESDWTNIDDDGSGNVQDRSVEIIGWLYQFFISERKDEVIGKVVAPEDIPAATQLFTPNWIVQYLVQNSLGRLWLESHPDSGLKAQMPYYIEPAEQEPEVQAQLDALIVKGRTAESLKVLDPACGSGHILLEAFRLLFQIYLEQGHRKRDIPRLIFENNLVGLDIDDRAAQLAGMSLLFEARQHDRRILSDPPQLRVHAFQNGTDADLQAIDGSQFSMKEEAKELVNFFREAKTFGSLLRLPFDLSVKLPDLHSAAVQSQQAGDLFLSKVAELLLPLIAQAEAIADDYDTVIANPPYMGSHLMDEQLKCWAESELPDSSHDLCVMVLDRSLGYIGEKGLCALVLMHSWMFASKFIAFRNRSLSRYGLQLLGHLGEGGFPGLSKYVVQTCMPIIGRTFSNFKAVFQDLREYDAEGKRQAARNKSSPRFVRETPGYFGSVQNPAFPQFALAYWLSERSKSIVATEPSINDAFDVRQGLGTGDNERFLRFWWEVSDSKIHRSCMCREEAARDHRKWYPHEKGSGANRWYCRTRVVINWKNDGQELADFVAIRYGSPTKRISSWDWYFRPGLCWSLISANGHNFRILDSGTVLGHKGPGVFARSGNSLTSTLAYLNSTSSEQFSGILSQGLGLEVGHIKSIPLFCTNEKATNAAQKLIDICKRLDRNCEDSIDYSRPQWLSVGAHISAEDAISSSVADLNKLKQQMDSLELLIDEECALDLDISPPTRTNFASPVLPSFSQQVRILCRYSIGCMMGRYSLDHEGLIYAHAGNIDFDPSKYPTFPADDDGIIPLTDEPWFEDDATERFAEFVSKAWPVEGLEDNLQFVAGALGPKKNETPRDTIRRYLSKDFYKDHCTTYKKRPIYWLFSSGKQQAFQCLVYLHRYNADTLGRIRTEYVTPLHGKMRARLANLEDERDQASSTAASKQAQKAIDALTKKLDELATFDDNLRHYADQRIELDLDDGVKVNIQKFGAIKGKGGLIDLKPLGKL